MISFEYAGEPIPAQRVRVTGRGSFNPKRYAEYKKGLVAALKGLSPMVLGRYRLEIEAYRSNRRPVDVDNLAKSVMDAIQEAGLIVNDSLIDELFVSKFVDPEHPRIGFKIFPI